MKATLNKTLFLVLCLSSLYCFSSDVGVPSAGTKPDSKFKDYEKILTESGCKNSNEIVGRIGAMNPSVTRSCTTECTYDACDPSINACKPKTCIQTCTDDKIDPKNITLEKAGAMLSMCKK